MKNFIIFLVALILSAIIMPIAFIYSLTTRFGWLGAYFWQVALSFDQTGNTVCQHLFNDLFIRPEGYRMGNEDETISSVLGKNKKTATLYPLGLGLVWILNKIDENHVEDAVE